MATASHRWLSNRRPNHRVRLQAQALDAREVPAVYSVTNTGDDTAAGSLRWAISQANGTANTPDIIDVTNVTGTITLTSALPTITDSITINGPGAASLTVSGASQFRVFQSGDTTTITPSTSINNLTVANGLASATGGGGLYATKGAVTLAGVAFSNNKATTGAGGAVLLSGTTGSLTVTDCTFTANGAASSTVGLTGGAIGFAGGPLAISIARSRFDSNSNGTGSGGAMGLSGSTTVTPTVSILDSTFSSNTAGNSGGVLSMAASGATVTITNSTFNLNMAGTGSGGALRLAGIVTINGSTLSDNTVAAGSGGLGGAITAAACTLTINNSTIVENSAGSGGQGGGIYVSGAGRLSLVSTIVANNSAGTGLDLFRASGSGVVISATNSLLGAADDINTTLATDQNNVTGFASSPIDPLLGPLAYNGGLVFTRLPQSGSPARDQGANPLGLTNDTRGAGYPRELPTGFPDIGAVEATSPTVPVAAIGSAPNVATAGGSTYSFTVRLGDSTAVQASSVQDNLNAVTVAGPSGSLTVNSAKLDTNTDGTQRTVTYTVAAPGGTFDVSDNGQYTITLVGGQISNLAGATAPAQALTKFSVSLGQQYTVTTTLDDGSTGSLRGAIELANFTNGPDTISFTPGLTGTISLLNGVMNITDPVAIDATGASIAVDGGGSSVFVVSGTPGQINVQFTGFTVQNASGPSGAALGIDDESVTLTRMRFQNNTSTANGSGGAVAATGGGAVLTVNDSTFTNNAGSTVTYGGAIYIGGVGSALAVSNSTFQNNSAARGGAIYVTDLSDTLTVTGSLFDGNQARFGGAIVQSGIATLRNSTFVNNTTGSANSTTSTFGGALYFTNGSSTIANSTLTKNSSTGISASLSGGGGINVASNVTLTITGSIIAGNTSTNTAAAFGNPDIQDANSTGGVPIAISDSVIGVAAGFTFKSDTNNQKGTLANPLDAKLGTLSSNGGPTQTIPLLAGSPALDLGPATSTLTTDQRGAGFPRVSNGKLDAGAFEVQAATSTKVLANSLVINGTAAQRSALYSVAIDFTDSINLTSTPAFTLTPSAGGAAITPSVTLTNGNKTAVLTFGTTNGYSTSLVTNGLYTLSIDGSKLTSNGVAVDGDGDGASGGIFTLAGSKANGLFRLYGDADGSGAVDAQDVTLFLNTYGTSVSDSAYRSYLDSGPQGGYSGSVDAQDVTDFLNTYGVTLP